MDLEVHKKFKTFENELIRHLGKHALTGEEIDNMAKYLFKGKYNGSFSVEDRFKLKNGYYILNTDKMNGNGVHWIAMYIPPFSNKSKNKNVYLYDSFGRDLKKNKNGEKDIVNVSKFIKRLEADPNKFKVKYDNKDAEQKKAIKGRATITCGHKSLAWLGIVKQLGIRKAMTI